MANISNFSMPFRRRFSWEEPLDEDPTPGLRLPHCWLDDPLPSPAPLPEQSLSSEMHHDEAPCSADDAEMPPQKEEQEQGYMQRASPFSLDADEAPPSETSFMDADEAPPSETSFMDSFPPGNASILYPNPTTNQVDFVDKINPIVIAERSPLLAAAFEESRGKLRLHLESLTSLTAIPFVRFLYTGSYASPTRLSSPGQGCGSDADADADADSDVPTSLLLHVQLHHLGRLYDLPELRVQAYLSVLRNCEFGCCSPAKPIDICPAVEFAYANLRSRGRNGDGDGEKVIDAIVNYCVACFTRHKLAEDGEMRALLWDLPAFNQDLCRESARRGFEEDAAMAIIQTPFKPSRPRSSRWQELGKALYQDTVFHFHSSDAMDEAGGPRPPSPSSAACSSSSSSERKKSETLKGKRRNLLEQLGTRLTNLAIRLRTMREMRRQQESGVRVEESGEGRGRGVGGESVAVEEDSMLDIGKTGVSSVEGDYGRVGSEFEMGGGESKGPNIASDNEACRVEAAVDSDYQRESHPLASAETECTSDSEGSTMVEIDGEEVMPETEPRRAAEGRSAEIEGDSDSGWTLV